VNLEHVRVLRPSEHLLGFYDGRVAGERFAPGPNWVDDGALSLGVCSYALIDGADAIVFDTHISAAHGMLIRRTLEGLGVRRMVVVLSHSHLDHVAGTAAFADCEIVSSRLTAERLTGHREAIEDGTFKGLPAISPLTLPTTVFDGQTSLSAGKLHADLVQFEIHSADGTALRVADEGLLLVGDMLEDTATYVSEAERLETHLHELERLRRIGAQHIYPDHGNESAIAAGGYGDGLIQATQRYVRDLLRVREEPALADLDLRSFVADSLEARWLTYYEPYERVHRSNLAKVTGGAGEPKPAP
jgi:glyoxylase-like metal-dependent hydrolase (beta-lactamase superfamily II)